MTAFEEEVPSAECLCTSLCVGSWLHQQLTLLFRLKPACRAGPVSQAPAAYHVLNDFILPVLPLYFEQVVTEVEQVKATLLAQQDDDGAACPVQTITETLPGSKERKRPE